jgi:hypothetical protein
MISFANLQLWILLQAMVTAFCWRYMGFGGLIGSLLGSFIYIALSQ